LKAVANKLLATLAHSGDRAEIAIRSVSRLDEIARVWLNGGKRFGGRFRLDGGDIILTEPHFEYHRLKRDEFDSNLSPSERRQIDHIERKMEALYEAWKKHDLLVENTSAQARADEFAAKLGSVVKDLLEILMNGGFQLEDHYEHIRSVVASYQREHGPQD
jgi:hypothetical protein